MTATMSTTPGLADVATAIRCAVRADVDWNGAARLVADGLRDRLPDTGIHTPERRLGDPDGPTGHLLVNTGTETAISLHVYGTDLSRVGSSARRHYEPANAEKRVFQWQSCGWTTSASWSTT